MLKICGGADQQIPNGNCRGNYRTESLLKVLKYKDLRIVNSKICDDVFERLPHFDGSVYKNKWLNYSPGYVARWKMK